MAYREDGTDTVDAPTAEGKLVATFAPRAITLDIRDRRVQIVDHFVTLTDTRRAKKLSMKVSGRLMSARDVPREDLGLWIELPDDGKGVGMRRIFGVEPVSLLTEHGLGALAQLDKLAVRLRSALAELSGDARRAVELGRGLDKVLLVDHGDRYALYARRLFRDRARFTCEIYADGKVVIPDGKTPQVVTLRSRFGVTVRGDYLRFTDRNGTDQARIHVPWIAPEDRLELARRIGQLVG